VNLSISDETTAGLQDRALVKRKIIIFVTLAFALSTVGYIATASSGETPVPLLVAPALAAPMTRFIFGEDR
jgi:hypothetical protein